MAKRKFSAKQLAAQRLFAKRAKAGTLRKGSKKRKSSTKTRTRTKVITKIRRVSSMPKKRKSTTSRLGLKKIPILSSPTFKKAAAGAGVGSLLAFGLGLIGQQQLAANPAVKAIAGFAVGDVVGAASAFLTSGGLSMGGQSQGNSGFA